MSHQTCSSSPSHAAWSSIAAGSIGSVSLVDASILGSDISGAYGNQFMTWEAMSSGVVTDSKVWSYAIGKDIQHSSQSHSHLFIEEVRHREAGNGVVIEA